jgi:hypothetical protein
VLVGVASTSDREGSDLAVVTGAEDFGAWATGSDTRPRKTVPPSATARKDRLIEFIIDFI